MVRVVEPQLPPGLERKRTLARAALWIEQVWPAIWPALGLLGTVAVFALLDGPAYLPRWPRALVPVGAVAGAALLLWWGLRRVARPGTDSVDRRLERDTGLRHRPLAVLQDVPAQASPEMAALWAVHRQRVLGQVRSLRVTRPRPGLARRDVRGLRFLVALGVIAAAVIAGPDAWPRLRNAVWPGVPPVAAAAGTVVQAWVTPPAYTGVAPVFLQAGVTPAAIPAGAHLTVSVTGGASEGGTEPTLVLEGDTVPFRNLDASSWQADRDVPALPRGEGRLSVRRGGSEIAAWTLTIVPDHPPTISFAEPPGPALANGRPTLRSRFAWKASDDYGIASVQTELRLRDRPDAPPLVLNAPVSGSPREAHGAITQDLTAHPWAGLEVIARMVARDAPGQRGEGEAVSMTLPERRFTNPAAQAVILIRKQLSRTPEQRQAAKDALDALAERGDLYSNAPSVTLNLHGVGALLLRGRGQAAVDEAQARLWALALALEDGGPDRTARALAEARKDLRDAMDNAKQHPDDPAAKAELEKKMEALREAIQKHFEALEQQARREGTENPLDPNVPQMNKRDMDQMAKRMEDAAKNGKMDDAQQQMAELDKLLEQLQNARPEHGEQRRQHNAQRRQQGQQQMDAVQDIIRREGGLLDRSRGRGDMPVAGMPPSSTPRPGAGAKPNPQAGQSPGQAQGPQQGLQQSGQPPGTQDRGQEQRTQNAMRRALGELMQRYGDLTGDIPAPLGEADMAMRDAGQALADGRDGAAAAAQQRAIEALQKGGRSMGQQLSRQFGTGEQEGEEGEGQEMGSEGQGQAGTGEDQGDKDGPGGQEPGQPGRRRSARRDPLGRPLPDEATGRDQGVDGSGSGQQAVPDEMEQARSRALQEELRRRGSDRTRPQRELDYIDRLLKSF